MSLTNYTEQPISNLLTETGAFFAFSKTQYAEKAQKDKKYCDMGGGLICPIENAKKLTEEMDKIYAEAIKQDLADNGIEKIILRELENHEAWYTYEISDTMEALIGYGEITEEQVWKVHADYAQNYDN